MNATEGETRAEWAERRARQKQAEREAKREEREADRRAEEAGAVERFEAEMAGRYPEGVPRGIKREMAERKMFALSQVSRDPKVQYLALAAILRLPQEEKVGGEELILDEIERAMDRTETARSI